MLQKTWAEREGARVPAYAREKLVSLPKERERMKERVKREVED